MRKIISVLLASLLTFALCANAFAMSSGGPEGAATASFNDESPIYPMDETEYYPEEQNNLPNGIRLISENLSEDYDMNMPDLQADGDEEEEEERGPTAFGVLVSTDEVASYTLEVDHDLFPEFIIGFYRYCTVNDFRATVLTESTQKAVTIDTNTGGGTNILSARRFLTFSKPEGGIENYTITIRTSVPQTGYAFIISTPDTFVDDFSGIHSFTTAAKNVPTDELRKLGLNQHMISRQALLNGGGDWFHYNADGETYITASIINWNNLAFEVYDLDTAKQIYYTTKENNVIRTRSDTLYEGYVQARLDLTPGKDYLIHFYSTSYKQVENLDDVYHIWMGLPSIQMEKIEYTSSLCSVAANTTRTFSFHLSDYPESMRASKDTIFRFTGGGKYHDYNITSCQITAPNGYSFSAPQGSKTGLSMIELDDYLNNPSNVPINGTWRITVKASQAIPNLKFSISGYVSQIIGNDGN